MTFLSLKSPSDRNSSHHPHPQLATSIISPDAPAPAPAPAYRPEEEYTKVTALSKPNAVIVHAWRVWNIELKCRYIETYIYELDQLERSV